MADTKLSVNPDIPVSGPEGNLSVPEQAKAENGAQKFWNGALKLVKGENTAKLIEDFTAEMTLVAEGLCEDQSKLRREVDKMITEKKVKTISNAIRTTFAVKWKPGSL